MMDNDTERYLIQKMAELCQKYKKPYDKWDEEAYKVNKEIEPKYNFCKQMLKDLCGF